MSHKTELLLILLSFIVMVCSKAVIKRSAYGAEDLTKPAEIDDAVLSNKRAVQTQRMNRFEYCLNNPFDRRCLRQGDYPTIKIIRV